MAKTREVDVGDVQGWEIASGLIVIAAGLVNLVSAHLGWAILLGVSAVLAAIFIVVELWALRLDYTVGTLQHGNVWKPAYNLIALLMIAAALLALWLSISAFAGIIIVWIPWFHIPMAIAVFIIFAKA